MGFFVTIDVDKPWNDGMLARPGATYLTFAVNQSFQSHDLVVRLWGSWREALDRLRSEAELSFS